MKIAVNPHLTQFTYFVNAIHCQFDKSGSVIHKKRNEIRVFDVDGLLINVKRFKMPHLFNRIMYSFFRKSKAQRSYQYALKLREMGIETPEPIAYILTKRRGLLHVSYYISRQINYEPALYDFSSGGLDGRHHLLEKFAEFTASFHEKGVFHKDYSPGNILFKEENGEIKIGLVDLNRMRFGNVSVKRGCANFARLWGQKPFFEFVVRKYAEKRDADPEQCVRWALQARKKFWKRFARKHPMPFSLDNNNRVNC